MPSRRSWRRKSSGPVNAFVYFLKAFGKAFVDALREPASSVAGPVGTPWDSMVSAASEEWVDPTVFRFTTVLPAGASYQDLADCILRAARTRPDLDRLQKRIASQYALSQAHALTSIDRALGGVVRAAALNPLASPDAAIDPVAAAAYALATADPTIIDSIYPDWREWEPWDPSTM